MERVFRNGEVMLPGGNRTPADIGVEAGRIAAIGTPGSLHGAEMVDCAGLTILPGVIDSQVHFREPGMEHKEDLATGTAAAAMGGVTAVFEMPNTNPLTVTAAAFADKMARADGRAQVDYAFYFGGTAQNAATLPAMEKTPGCAGIKVFMGSSTGDLLTEDDPGLDAILTHGVRRIAVHAEDEMRLRERFALVENGAPVAMHPEWRDVETALRATRRLVSLARARRRLIHVLHITTADEIAYLGENKDIATCELTPNHLTLTAPDCYERLGSKAQMNPPVRDAHHQAGLWAGIADGTVDVLGSDHAPHTLEEKAQPYPKSPSGMTGVQTLVPIMLTHVANGKLTLERFVELTSAGPQRIFQIAGKGRIARGYDADFTIVDLKRKQRIENSWIASKAGWTPFDGMEATGWPIMTVVRGTPVMRDAELIGDPAGAPVRFLASL